jgi:phosphate starvation-inducible membrane PsiE
MVATAAAGARDTTRLEPLVSFFIFLYHTNVYFKSTPSQCVETTMAATASVDRDATHLEPLVCFFLWFLFITLIIF